MPNAALLFTFYLSGKIIEKSDQVNIVPRSMKTRDTLLKPRKLTYWISLGVLASSNSRREVYEIRSIFFTYQISCFPFGQKLVANLYCIQKNTFLDF